MRHFSANKFLLVFFALIIQFYYAPSLNSQSGTSSYFAAIQDTEEFELLESLDQLLYEGDYESAAETLLELSKHYTFEKENYYSAVKAIINGVKIAEEHALYDLRLDFLAHMVECQMRLPKDLDIAQEYLNKYFQAILDNDTPLKKAIGNYYQQRIIGRIRMSGNKLDSGTLQQGVELSKKCLDFFKTTTETQTKYFVLTRQDIALYYPKEYGLNRCLQFLEEVDEIISRNETTPSRSWHQIQKASVYAAFGQMNEALFLLEEDPDMYLHIGDAGRIYYYKILHKIHFGNKNYLEATKALEEEVKYASSLSHRSYSNMITTVLNQNKIEETIKANQIFSVRWKYSLIIGTLMFLGLCMMIYVYRRNRKQEKRISLQNSHLEELNATKDKLVSILAHDLRAPIVSFKDLGAKVNFLIKRKEWETLNNLGSSIESKISELSSMLDTLLPWALSKKNNTNQSFSSVIVQDLIKDAITECSSRLKEKNIHVAHDIPNDLSIKTDKTGVRIIIRNLLSNSIKYSPSGSRVTINTVKKGNDLKISVQDQGRGMSEDELNDIFNTYRSRPGLSGEEGHGLGLKISKDLAISNGGDLTMESSQGQGTEATLHLPIKQ